MKRKQVLAKLMAMGLAIAMTATSVGSPGGLLAPIEVKAEENKTTLEEGTAAQFFTVVKSFVLPASGSPTNTDVFSPAEGKTADDLGTVVLSWKQGETDKGDWPTEAGTYDVYAKITAAGTTDTGLAVTEGEPVKIGTGVKVYEYFADGGVEITSDNANGISDARVGDELTASVSGGTDNQKDAYTDFKWYQVGSDGSETPINEATAANYTIKAADKDKSIRVKVSATGEKYEELSSVTTSAVKLAAYEGTLPAWTDVFDDESEKGKIKIKDTVSLGDLEYTVNGTAEAPTWNDLPSDKIIPLVEGTKYENGDIQIRVKEVTGTTEASDPITYEKAISPTITGTPKLDKDAPKYKETITASVESAPAGQSGAVYKYQFYRVPKTGNAVELTKATTSAAYTVTRDDLNCNIKVVITAEGYEGELEKTTSTEVGAAAARTLTISDVEQVADPANVKVKCTVKMSGTPEEQGTVQYACVEGADAAALTDENAWQVSPEFSVTPGTKAAFYAKYVHDEIKFPA